MPKSKILVIVGTTRQGRSGRKVADWYMTQVAEAGVDADFELLDVAEPNEIERQAAKAIPATLRPAKLRMEAPFTRRGAITMRLQR